jgi:hypothetical protein
VSGLAVAPAPVEAPTDDGDELGHWVCCRDEDRALCGADVTGHAWVNQGQMLDCVVCDELLRAGTCPLGGHCDHHDDDDEPPPTS